jgi:ubiquinone/menaquinone biosynthesis C-methylase UbiE
MNETKQSTMQTHDEVARLVEVYRHYHGDARIRAQWDERNPGNQAIDRERKRVINELLGDHGFLPLENRRVLDVGCGSGRILSSFLKLGACPENLYGVDLLPERIEQARSQFPDLQFRSMNAEHLEFPDAFFDIVALFTVFSSILDKQMAGNVAQEVIRALRPNGAVLWYDFRYNNPRNPNVRGVKMEDVASFFPDLEKHIQSVTVLPPLSRRLGWLTPMIYPVLGRVPLLRTHYLGLLLKRVKG